MVDLPIDSMVDISIVFCKRWPGRVLKIAGNPTKHHPVPWFLLSKLVVALPPWKNMRGKMIWLVLWNHGILLKPLPSWDDDPIWLIFFRGVGQPPTRLGGSSHEVGYKPNWSKDQPDFWKKQGYHLLTELDDPPSRKYIGKCIGKTIENSWHGHGTQKKNLRSMRFGYG